MAKSLWQQDCRLKPGDYYLPFQTILQDALFFSIYLNLTRITDQIWRWGSKISQYFCCDLSRDCLHLGAYSTSMELCPALVTVCQAWVAYRENTFLLVLAGRESMTETSELVRHWLLCYLMMETGLENMHERTSHALSGSPSLWQHLLSWKWYIYKSNTDSSYSSL